MTRTRILLAAALAVVSGSTYAQSKPYSPDTVWRSNSAPITDRSESDAPLIRGSSSAALNVLFSEWDHAAFNPPGKPGQSRVYGRDGYVTTGGGYNYMVTLIRSAATDVREGRDRDAAPKIATVRRVLAASNLRRE